MGTSLILLCLLVSVVLLQAAGATSSGAGSGSGSGATCSARADCNNAGECENTNCVCDFGFSGPTCTTARYNDDTQTGGAACNTTCVNAMGVASADCVNSKCRCLAAWGGAGITTGKCEQFTCGRFQSPKDSRNCRALSAIASDFGFAQWGNRGRWFDALDVTASPCLWEGLECDYHGAITQLRLADLRSSSSLNDMLEQLMDLLGGFEDVFSALQTLDISNSPQLHGTLDHIGRLPVTLTELNICGTAVSGMIPSTVAMLHNLESLDLYNNNLMGPIPDAMGKLSHLKFFSAFGNSLGGVLPSSLKRLSALEVFDLTGLPNITDANALCGLPPSFWSAGPGTRRMCPCRLNGTAVDRNPETCDKVLNNCFENCI